MPIIINKTKDNDFAVESFSLKTPDMLPADKKKLIGECVFQQFDKYSEIKLLYFTEYNTTIVPSNIAKYKKIFKRKKEKIFQYIQILPEEIKIFEDDIRLIYAVLLSLPSTETTFMESLKKSHDSFNGHLMFLTHSTDFRFDHQKMLEIFEILKRSGESSIHSKDLALIFDFIPDDAVIVRTFGFFDDSNAGIKLIHKISKNQ